MSTRRWRMGIGLGALMLAVLTGCAASVTRGALDDAGYSGVIVQTSAPPAGSVHGTVRVSLDAPPGRSFEATVADIQRIVWQNHPEPLAAVVVIVDGRRSALATRDDLWQAFGSRGPAVLERLRDG